MNKGCLGNPVPNAGPEPGAAKAWCKFVPATTGPIQILCGYNVREVQRKGTGDYYVVFIRPFATPHFSCSVVVKPATDVSLCVHVDVLDAGVASAKRIGIIQPTVGRNDPAEVYFTAWGEQ